MKNFRFEIRKQLGFARSGKLTVGEQVLFTPAILFPQLNAINHHLNYEKSFLGEEYAFIELEDPLNITPTNNSSLNEISKESSQNNQMSRPFFIESKSQWGIPSIIENSSDISRLELEKIPILSENFPNSSTTRYENYEYEIFKKRLQMYAEILFSQNATQKYIIEIKFSPDSHKLAFLQSWLQNNLNSIIGIKISDLFKNLMYASDILDWITTLKQKLPSNILWILGGQIFPQDYHLAIYYGFDLIDASSVLYSSMKGMYISNSSRKWLRELSFPLCACEYCNQLSKYIPNSGKETFDQKILIINHNLHTISREIRVIKQFLTDGTLRTYIEAQIHSSPLAGSLLRITDKKYSQYINRRYPLVNSHQVLCIGPESYLRPEIQNFIQRVKEEITPARTYKIVVILPCSAKKPYSQSKSHQKFQKVIRNASTKQFYNEIHQVIITSPVGVIPRELEKVFPAGHYDIPVTGDWDTDEINITSTCLADWMQKYSNLSESNSDSLLIIAHVAGGYRKACKHAESILHSKGISCNFQYTIENEAKYSASSDIALDNLNALITNHLEKQKSFVNNESNDLNQQTKHTQAISLLTEDEIIIRATLDYQFGKGAGDLIVQRSAFIMKGKWPQYNDVYTYDGAGKILVGRIVENTGLFKLTPSGGELFLTHPRNLLSIKEEDLQGTTIFKPILRDIDLATHPGDDMIVLNKNNIYLGIGELIQAPEDAQLATQGKICTLKKKKSGTPKSFQNDLDLLNELEGDE